jgi:hypothetical protein
MKLNGIPPERSSMWGKEEGLVEIPRFKKRELNLGIAGGGLGQRVGWVMLWLGWLIWGLLSLVRIRAVPRCIELMYQFFDVNVLYMLVQYVLIFPLRSQACADLADAHRIPPQLPTRLQRGHGSSLWQPFPSAG